MQGEALKPKLVNHVNTVMTTGVAGLLTDLEALELVRRHCSGDWGDVCDDDKEGNDQNVTTGDMLISEFNGVTSSGQPYRVWVITDPGHETTTVLLPDEY